MWSGSEVRNAAETPVGIIVGAGLALTTAIKAWDTVEQDQVALKRRAGGAPLFDRHGNPKVVGPGKYMILPLAGGHKKVDATIRTSATSRYVVNTPETRDDLEEKKQFWVEASFNWRIKKENPWYVYRAVTLVGDGLSDTVEEHCQSKLRGILGRLTIGEIDVPDTTPLFDELRFWTYNKLDLWGVVLEGLNLKPGAYVDNQNVADAIIKTKGGGVDAAVAAIVPPHLPGPNGTGNGLEVPITN